VIDYWLHQNTIKNSAIQNVSVRRARGSGVPFGRLARYSSVQVSIPSSLTTTRSAKRSRRFRLRGNVNFTLIATASTLAVARLAWVAQGQRLAFDR
jgi:hypothetical protein